MLDVSLHTGAVRNRDVQGPLRSIKSNSYGKLRALLRQTQSRMRTQRDWPATAWSHSSAKASSRLDDLIPVASPANPIRYGPDAPPSASLPPPLAHLLYGCDGVVAQVVREGAQVLTQLGGRGGAHDDGGDEGPTPAMGATRASGQKTFGEYQMLRHVSQARQGPGTCQAFDRPMVYT